MHFIEHLLSAKSLGMIPDERLKLILWNDDSEALVESLTQGQDTVQNKWADVAKGTAYLSQHF
jgi:hypothetical protein